jgi:hypothetical protein
MTLNGPIISHENTADDFERAHCYQRKKLPIALNGPIIVNQKNADTLEWAQYIS